MRIFNENSDNNTIGLLKTIPSAVEHYSGNTSKWVHTRSDKMKIILKSGCMHCANPRCFIFNMKQISSDIPAFSFDRNQHVCPVDAITWDTKNNFPIIDTKQCIQCGICARMCPVGAIYFKETIQISESNNVELVSATRDNLKKQRIQLSRAQEAFHIGRIFNESDSLMENIYKRLQHISGNIPNVFARNLLIALGNRCAISRVGDVYTRLDAMLETSHHIRGVVEVEFGRDTLDAARGILDDIAVANCRYGIPKKDNLALVICLQLPNERQGFWQVIKDIKKVEGILINTVTIGGLLLLMWNFQDFNMEEVSFYVDFDDMSIRKKIDYILDSDTTVNISSHELGILEPEK